MAENQDSELDALIQGAAPVAEAPPPKPEPPKKSGASSALLGGLIGFLVLLVGGFLYLDAYVQKKNAKLEEEYQKRKREYSVQARRRMYDNMQGQLQAEMMDRLKINKELEGEPKKHEVRGDEKSHE
ncbi:MAG: hypothetical protein HQL73_02940 [Magnetococcales bacterium]|nr:hypothetical protein [Magnetococcales bacterium]